MKKLALFIFFLSSALVYGVQNSYALNGNDFPFGRIIDDQIFRDKDTMTVNQIQTFLESKVNGGACDRWRPTYNQNYQPPYTCLFEFQQNPSTGQNNYGQFNPDGSPASIPGGQTAAQIIWQAAQDFNINPQVLIVLLQKEQGLVTDNWPWTIQYSKAAGYNCPDTAPCNPATADFSKQVRGAAWSFNYYIQNLDSYWYGIGYNDILYNPNTACGRKTIYIENAATVALYLYTPYTPNQAALDNLYGTGDSCSAYGNRNFWRFFNDWFGATNGLPNYSWSLESQKIYTDSSESVELNKSAIELEYGERAYAVVTVRNDGNQVWSRAGVRMGTVDANQEPLLNSSFCDQTWLSCNRPTRMDETYVQPGDTATFKFWIKTPEVAGTQRVYLNVLWEGITWFPTIGLFYEIDSLTPDFRGQLVSQDYSTSQANSASSSSLKNNSIYTVSYKVRNIGSQTWSKAENSVRIGTKNNYTSPLCHSSWISCNRPAGMQENIVEPGEIATFNFQIATPYAVNGTVFNEEYELLIENQFWFDGPLIEEAYKMNTPRTTWSIVTLRSFTNPTKQINLPTNNMSIGQKRWVELRVRNLSGSVWNRSGNGPIRLATNSPRNSSSKVCDITWLSCNRPARMKESTVQPGEIATFEFWIWGKENMNILENYILVSEGKYWLGNAGLYFHYVAD